MQLIAAVLACTLAIASAAPSEDEITSLPGWQGKLPSRMWSGYVTIGGGSKHVHYWYTESQASPENAPVVLWSNGGPGSSSLIGMLTELGTFSLDGRSLNGTATPTLIANEHTWAKQGNMLYFEHPTPVGFSYCDNAEACTHDDQGAADDLYACIEAFFTLKFPELKGRPFYLTGESYAGIYLPMTLRVIAEKADPSVINLQGMAHGDGCIGNMVGTCSDEGPGILATFLHGQNFISTKVYSHIQEQCVNYFDPSEECRKALRDMEKSAGDYYVYMVDDLCPSDHVSGRRSSQGVIRSSRDMLVENSKSGGLRLADFVDEVSARHAVDSTGRRLWSSDIRTSHETAELLAARGSAAGGAQVSADGTARTGTPVWYCDSDAAMGAWLNDPAVQKAIHVKTNVPDFHFNYTRSEPNLLPYYPEMASKYRILIYSGNADACVPTPGSEQWTSGLGFKEIDAWRPWVGPINGANQAGGFATTYEPNNFSFVTLTLSGHMAPQFVSEAASIMLDRFLNNKAY